MCMSTFLADMLKVEDMTACTLLCVPDLMIPLDECVPNFIGGAPCGFQALLGSCCVYLKIRRAIPMVAFLCMPARVATC